MLELLSDGRCLLSVTVSVSAGPHRASAALLELLSNGRRLLSGHGEGAGRQSARVGAGSAPIRLVYRLRRRLPQRRQGEGLVSSFPMRGTITILSNRKSCIRL